MLLSIRAIAAAIDVTRPNRVLTISDYGAQHEGGTGIPEIFHHMEKALSNSRVDLVLLRSAQHMENWARSLAPAERGVLPSMIHPASRPVPMVSALDVGKVARHILVEIWTSHRSVVRVEGPRRYSVNDVATAFASLVGREVHATEILKPMWSDTLEASGMHPATAAYVSRFFGACNTGLIEIESLPGGTVRRGATELFSALKQAVFGRPGLLKGTPARKLAKLDGGERA